MVSACAATPLRAYGTPNPQRPWTGRLRFGVAHLERYPELSLRVGLTVEDWAEMDRPAMGRGTIGSPMVEITDRWKPWIAFVGTLVVGSAVALCFLIMAIASDGLPEIRALGFMASSWGYLVLHVWAVRHLARRMGQDVDVAKLVSEAAMIAACFVGCAVFVIGAMNG